MTKKLSRREILGTLGLAAGTALATVHGGEPAGKTPASGEAWHYVPLDPEQVAAEAYRIKGSNGCMYAVFRATAEAWAKQSGQSLDAFPFHMFQYGDGGIGHWGTTCGALNGAAALIGLFETDKTRREERIDEVFRWYEQAELPAYQPAGDAPAIKTGVAESVLCHISVSRWCEASGAEPISPSRKERCRRLTADVARKTVEVLNHGPAEPARTSETPAQAPLAVGKMRCGTCHEASDKSR